jgi:tetratricopeptide (TPR) repeat protein
VCDLSAAVGERAGIVSDGTTGQTPVPPYRHRRFRLVLRLLIFLVSLGLAASAGAMLHPHLRAWQHRRAARTELERYHTRQAMEHLRICRDTWPNDPEALLLAARAARRARIYSESERLLAMHRKARGHDTARAFEQFLLTTECDVAQVADTCWNHVENGHKDTPLLLEAMTRGYLRQYRLDWARRCLDRWRQLQPDNPEVFCLDGLFKLDYLHDLPTGTESYRRAVELDPDHEEARLGLAVALLEAKSFSQAAEHFKYLLQCQPDNLRVQVALAECLDGLCETAEASRLLDEVLAQQPEYPVALLRRGQLALRSGRLAEAESWLRQALRREPRDRRIHYGLIICLEQSGRDQEARRQRQQLKEIEEDLARFNKIATEEIVKHPTDPALHCTLGQLLLRSGQREEGIRWLRSALHLDPNYAPARQAMKDYLSQAKDKAESSSP